MSWEVDGTTEHPCPCGEGVWIEISESDDWSRHRSSAKIECPKCQKTHRIEEVLGHDKGIPTVSYRVVSTTVPQT